LDYEKPDTPNPAKLSVDEKMFIVATQKLISDRRKLIYHSRMKLLLIEVF